MSILPSYTLLLIPLIGCVSSPEDECSAAGCESTTEDALSETTGLMLEGASKSPMADDVEEMLISQSVHQSMWGGYKQGQEEAKAVFEMFFYKDSCNLLKGSPSEEQPGKINYELVFADDCWTPKSNDAHESFVSFCNQYQANILKVACSAGSCVDFREYRLAFLRGFNQYMTLNPELFVHGYIGELDPECNTPC